MRAECQRRSRIFHEKPQCAVCPRTLLAVQRTLVAATDGSVVRNGGRDAAPFCSADGGPSLCTPGRWSDATNNSCRACPGTTITCQQLFRNAAGVVPSPQPRVEPCGDRARATHRTSGRGERVSRHRQLHAQRYHHQHRHRFALDGDRRQHHPICASRQPLSVWAHGPHDT